MRSTFDPEADASYVSLLDRDLRRGEAAQQSEVIDTPSGAGSVIVDYDKDGRLLAFEIVHPRKQRWSRPAPKSP